MDAKMDKVERATLNSPLPIRERQAVPVALAAQFIGISRTRVYELMQDGTLQGKIITGKRVVLVDSLLRLIGEAPSTTIAKAA